MTAKRKQPAKRSSSGRTRGVTTAVDPPASLVKRVAEAAAGMRNGRQVWFVASMEFPHQVKEHHSEAEADADRSAKGEGHVILGPFLTPPDALHKKKIEWIQVKVEGVSKVLRFDPADVDALFWSLSALDKFLYPYYTMLYGPEKAAEMRRKYLEPTNISPLVCHQPSSDECNPPWP